MRAEQMVVDIPATADNTAYAIVGELHGAEYRGKNQNHVGRSDVTAVWAKVGKYYMGTWVEHGDEYIFFFELPRERIEPPPNTRRIDSGSAPVTRPLMRRIAELDKKIEKRKAMEKKQQHKQKKSSKVGVREEGAKDESRAKTPMEVLSDRLKRAVAEEAKPTKKEFVYAPK